MSEATTKKIVFWADTVFRFGTPIMGCVMAGLLLWLDGKYTTKAEATAMRLQIQELHDAVIRLERSADNDRRHDEQFAKIDIWKESFDSRLRAVESRK